MTTNTDFFEKRARTKSYLHFDRKISSDKIADYVTNPKRIEEHPFFPFIHFEIIHNKVYYDKTNKKLITKIKEREIKYPCHMDGHIYAYYAFLLSKPYEEYLKSNELHLSVLAFRKYGNKFNNIHFAKMAFNEVHKRQNCVAICLDIEKFFDRLDHNIIKNNWATLLGNTRLPNDHFKVYQSICKFAFVDKETLYQALGLSINSRTLNRRYNRLCDPSDFRLKIRGAGHVKVNPNSYGIPQGSPISALISNIYLMDFDKAVSAEIERSSGLYLRYCDDILVITDEAHVTHIEQFITNYISKLKLTINAEKTQKIQFIDGICPQNKNLQYLGFTFNGEKILLRDAGLIRYYYKQRKAIRMLTAKQRRINAIRISKGLPPRTIYLKHLFHRFTHLGRRNYIRYALRAANILDSNVIRTQVSKHWKKFKVKLNKQAK